MLFIGLAQELKDAPIRIKVIRTYVELLGRRHARFAIDYKKLAEYCESAGFLIEEGELRELIGIMARNLGVMTFEGTGKGGKIYRLSPRLYSGATIDEDEFLMRLQLPRPTRFFGLQTTLVKPVVSDHARVIEEVPKPKRRRGKGNRNWVILNGSGGKFKR